MADEPNDGGTTRPGRRRFVVLGAAAALGAAGAARFWPGEWVTVGLPSSVPAEGVFHFVHEGSGVFLLRSPGGEIYALSETCSHQGCRIAWSGADRRFECPCHQGVFNLAGEPIAGRPLRPLEQFEVRVLDGMLQVRI